jgi:hypothetical protein
MKLQNLSKDDLERFFAVVDKCKGDVTLVIKDQMELNLKSKLSQFMALVGLFSQANVPQIEIYCKSKEDVPRLIDFMVADGGTW